jgi:protein phosphatase
LADGELGLYVVCDGVGGRASGEVASRETARLIWEWIKQEKDRLPKPEESLRPEHVGHLCHIVRSAIQNACYMVHSLGELDPAQKGMSTTASVVLIVGALCIIGQVGDSRVYLSRGGRVLQLTEDHTLINYQLKNGLISAEQARKSTAKNIITRAVGHRDYVEVDIHPVGLNEQDRIMLCSDGLHGYLDDVTEVETLMQLELNNAVQRAVNLANARGGHDNITALMVECVPSEGENAA